jgi:hypothetical protein
VVCLCGKTEGDGLMVQCDLCLTWQHGTCLNISSEDQVSLFFILLQTAISSRVQCFRPGVVPTALLLKFREKELPASFNPQSHALLLPRFCVCLANKSTCPFPFPPTVFHLMHRLRRAEVARRGSIHLLYNPCFRPFWEIQCA